ncbi:2OG-Fe(II) oxygenase [Rhodococcus sp. ARC_M6]|uniref:2OG-Fe(II) oxygenase n=1 Tax=Rhodococcus sp. ARC_M6 TaxID=2928852 RepID=UPI001FB5235E|nr:2OG-Fe(II) oxygenase [Rhodococcus sp. ARC_M6]MCJ0905868.1 2OG-Fe(II) oxygenase [Rhodococcus sp. ARC_M6]
MDQFSDLPVRVDSLDWPALIDEIEAIGCAQGGPLLTASECAEIASWYGEAGRFRSTIDMARYRFGQGEYRYFGEPVPVPITALRGAFYRKLLPLAREWAFKLGDQAPWPDAFDDWIVQCHSAGQTRPTPILLTYGPGDWNALHRDLYGQLVFPLQVVIGLDRPRVDHAGGEFMVVEQRPRAQSKGTVTVLEQGHALIFTTRDRPVLGSRGWSRVPVRHGVSVVRSGFRRTLGLVLHDAE